MPPAALANTAPAPAPIPSAPAHMSDNAAKQWTAAYTKALAQAKLDNPNNVPAQRAAALKAANALLAVPAPTSATDIDKLEAWQVLVRETRIVKGQELRVCVTADGRKYSFPLTAAEQASAKKAATPSASELQKDADLAKSGAQA